ncbi:hypothetical protein ISS37_05895 [candidate division KSB1 bacterium]|nr:hypothetical protein [candidate division KSB1 bacterium]
MNINQIIMVFIVLIILFVMVLSGPLEQVTDVKKLVGHFLPIILLGGFLIYFFRDKTRG